MEQKPSLGRVVHYVATNGEHMAADICGIPDNAEGKADVHLFVKDPFFKTTYFVMNTPFEQTGQYVGTWHWPERV